MAEKGLEVVALFGAIGSGKNHRAKLLVKKGFVHIDFKDALLDMVSDLVGYNVREDYDWFKKHIVGMRRPANPADEAFVTKVSNEIIAANPEALTGRRLLQRLGTEVMRKRDQDYWANQFKTRAVDALKSGKSVVSADCRFFNEIGIVRGLKWAEYGRGDGVKVTSKLVFCDYRSDRYDASSTHESEALANALLKVGLEDGDEIRPHHLERVRGFMGQKELV